MFVSQSMAMYTHTNKLAGCCIAAEDCGKKRVTYYDHRDRLSKCKPICKIT